MFLGTSIRHNLLGQIFESVSKQKLQFQNKSSSFFKNQIFVILAVLCRSVELVGGAHFRVIALGKRSSF